MAKKPQSLQLLTCGELTHPRESLEFIPAEPTIPWILGIFSQPDCREVSPNPSMIPSLSSGSPLEDTGNSLYPKSFSCLSRMILALSLRSRFRAPVENQDSKEEKPRQREKIQARSDLTFNPGGPAWPMGPRNPIPGSPCGRKVRKNQEFSFQGKASAGRVWFVLLHEIPRS